MTVVAVSLFKIMDKIMLGIITTAEQVGFYEVAEKIIAIPTVFITSLGTVMLPRMSNLAGKGKTEENRLLYASAILQCLWFLHFVLVLWECQKHLFHFLWTRI